MSFFEDIKQRASEDLKTIVLPEAGDIRILKSASIAIKENMAKIVLIGKKEEIDTIVFKYNEEEKDDKEKIDITNAKIYDPEAFEDIHEYTNMLYEILEPKGVTFQEAQELIKNNTYFAMMLLKQGLVDGLVAGAVNSTAQTLRPALRIIKKRDDSKLVSAFFLMELKNKEIGSNGVLLYADSGLVENPDFEELSEIAIESAKSFKNILKDEPRLAFLSYSSKGSANSELTEKMVKASNLTKLKAPELILDGELQFDAAIIPDVAKVKAPNSPLNRKC